MKQLFVVRHAKSSWGSPGLNDFDRPLNDRGHRDGPMMAKRLWDKGIRLDAVVTSPANRALNTARYFSTEFHLADKQVIEIPALYHAAVSVFYEVIASAIKNEWESVALFSHNPGITEFVNSCGIIRLDNMPTTAICGFSFEAESWKDFKKAEKSLLFFDYPKLTTGL